MNLNETCQNVNSNIFYNKCEWQGMIFKSSRVQKKISRSKKPKTVFKQLITNFKFYQTVCIYVILIINGKKLLLKLLVNQRVDWYFTCIYVTNIEHDDLRSCIF